MSLKYHIIILKDISLIPQFASTYTAVLTNYQQNIVVALKIVTNCLSVKIRDYI